MKRTHTCGQLTLKNVNQNVILQGWVAKIRKMGAMTFVDLRDRYGITQLVLDDSINLENIKSEYVIEVTGIVIERKSKNLEISTGEIEIKVSEINLINKSELTPFEIKNNIDSQEETRLTYRYLDLRRPEIQQKIITRSKMNHVIRNFFIENDFIEIETPIFGKSTPEGARDFLVPSRLNENKFYALPQSPQLYKQLFMISGFDRYFQIVKCFRDEDLRIDRQPEFTQIDMEMAFADKEDVMQIMEDLIKKVILEIKRIEIKDSIQRITWKESIDKYGNDKPDLRFNLEIETLNHLFKNTQIPLFSNLENKAIRAICVNSTLNKKELEELTQTAFQNSVNILGFAKYDLNDWTGSIGSKLSESEKKDLIKHFSITNNSTILFVVEEYFKASQAMGAIRNHVAKLENLINNDEMKLLWVVDFPLFEFSEEENRFVAAHHPFTMPSKSSLQNFEEEKASALAEAYDLVLNGFEIGGGSQRITDPIIQQKMFDAIGLTQSQVEQNFGWFINAYKYGAPNHAGCALGLDRICMILTSSNNIREVIAFPKNSSGVDSMTNAPDIVTQEQLDELSIKLK
ncbi:aspartate--tRNA ligase [Spiroplasma taiwanense]|uniref:Aspartate--tRNA ligase n=1 Tax=Spiroplasma taiwanense CT-1 TaxID=1276220 RepID=S5LZE3_9MOLU|nr:aspartate--tRNA ligase [Spiroplasma taiwanense]AGR41077.1 aspartyl-tRNA synthetase [Spiroplasma taiwanense CT-1]